MLQEKTLRIRYTRQAAKKSLLYLVTVLAIRLNLQNTEPG